MTEKRGLARTLDQLVKQAETHPGQPQRQPLLRGLRVDVLMTADETHLQISRDNIWPSSREWATVTSIWPRPVPRQVLPKRLYAQGRYFLQAKWATITGEQPALLNENS